MDQMTIRELVDAVIAELRLLGYRQHTIHNYEKIYEDLIQYADEEHVTKYFIEFGEKYLREVRGIASAMSHPVLTNRTINRTTCLLEPASALLNGSCMDVCR